MKKKTLSMACLLLIMTIMALFIIGLMGSSVQATSLTSDIEYVTEEQIDGHWYYKYRVRDTVDGLDYIKCLEQSTQDGKYYEQARLYEKNPVTGILSGPKTRIDYPDKPNNSWREFFIKKTYAEAATHRISVYDTQGKDNCDDTYEIKGTDPKNPKQVMVGVGGIIELPQIEEPGTAIPAPDSSGHNYGASADIIAGAIAGVTALISAAWYIRRRRTKAI